MSAWTNGTYTNKGLALLAKLTQGNSLQITRALSGTGFVSQTNLAKQTAVTGIKQTLMFGAASYPETGLCKLPMYLTNDGLAAGYKARQIGIYAFDPDEGEILYFITQSETGTDVPSKNVMPEYSATWTFYFRYGQADKVNVTVDPSHTITADMLNEVRVIAEMGVSAPDNGHALAIKNTAELPFANLRLFGKTTQNGSPTPDNPVEMESPSPSAVYVFKRNLLPVSGEGRTWNGITFTINSDGTVTTQGTATDLAYFNFETSLPKGYYHVSGCPSGGNVTSGYFVRVVTSASGTDKTEGDDTGDGFSLYLPERKTVIVRVAIRKGVYANNLVFKPMVCLDAVKGGGFEKCSSQTLAISTPNGLLGIPVSSDGNYTDVDGQQWVCDEIDYARGVRIQRVFEETVSLSYDETYTRYVGQLSNGAALRCAEGSGIPVLSNILPFNPNASFGSNGIRVSSSGNKMLIACYNQEAITSATVAYPLETPIETPLTAEEVAAFDALHSNNPVTTITNNGDANMEVDCFLAQHEAGFKRIINYVQRHLLTQ